MRRSRDEDCRLSNESFFLSPRAALVAFALWDPFAFARGINPLVARLPSTRLLQCQAFDLFTAEGALL